MHFFEIVEFESFIYFTIVFRCIERLSTDKLRLFVGAVSLLLLMTVSIKK